MSGLVLCFDAANPKSYNVGIATTAWNDLSGNGNNGRLIGGVGYEDANRGILRFDGVNDYADCGPVPAIGSSLTGLTVNVWINPSVRDVKCIAENGTNYTTNTFYMFQENANYFTFAVWGGGGVGYDVVYANFIYQTNTWYNLTGVWSSNNRLELYCNGVLCSGTRGGVVQTSVINGNTNLLLGSRNYGSFPFAGKYSYASFYNRALTAAEVLQNYNALKFRFVQPSPKVVDDGLILYLDAADVDSYPAFGTIWTDLSGRGNNGTLDNGVGYSNEFGGALTFDGVNDSVTIADNFDFRNTFPSGNFTITSVSKSTDTTTYPKSSHPFWIQTYVLNNAGAIANKGMSSADGSNATSFGIEVNDGGNYFIGYINHIVNVSTVYHRSFVVDRSNGFALRYYVNGNLLGEIKSASVTGTIYTTGGMSFGNMYGWMFNGSLYRLSVHNKALTSTEVLQNYNAVKGKFGI